MTRTKDPRGRPRRAKTTSTARISPRFTAAERLMIERAAADAGMTPSAFVRAAALQRARTAESAWTSRSARERHRLATGDADDYDAPGID